MARFITDRNLIDPSRHLVQRYQNNIYSSIKYSPRSEACRTRKATRKACAGRQTNELKIYQSKYEGDGKQSLDDISDFIE